MKNRKLFIAVVVLCAVAAQTLPARTLAAEGMLNEKEVRTRAFKRLAVGGQFNVYLSQGKGHELTIKTYKSIMPYVDVKQTNGVLNVTMDRRINRIRWNGKDRVLDLYITVENPESIRLAGACDLMAETDIRVEEFKLTASGASDVALKDVDANMIVIRNSGATDMKTECITARELECHMSGASDFAGELDVREADLRANGASDFVLRGRAENMTLNLSGSSTLKAPDLLIDTANLRATGSSDCRIGVEKELKVVLSGASTLHYSGDAALTDIQVSGAANIKKNN